MKTIRLLTIGNSFSNNALAFLENITAGTDEVRFVVERASLGGCSLEKHWNLARYTAVHPQYSPYAAGSLQHILRQEPWDIVTLQQVSRQSWLRESFQPYLDRLCTLVREHAPQAEILLHQTWAYRTDSPFLVENCLTQDIMHERIQDGYGHYSATLGCRILPSGTAVHIARKAEGRRFAWPESDFDYQHAVCPALPKQEHSLAVGWRWAIESTHDGIPRMQLDANHLNARGCYLAGAVWFSVLTGLDIRHSRFVPEGIAADDLAFLQAVAGRAVAASV